MRDLICARAKVTPPAPAPAPEATPAPPPPSPPVPAAATNVYTGSFSGEATSELPGLTQTWSGTVRLDAAQDTAPPAPPPHGAPPGSYRIFTASSGSIDVTIAVRPPSGCRLDGTGHFDLLPGFFNQVIVQLDVPNPAYVVAFSGQNAEFVVGHPVGRAGVLGHIAVPRVLALGEHRRVRAHVSLVRAVGRAVGADAPACPTTTTTRHAGA